MQIDAVVLSTVVALVALVIALYLLIQAQRAGKPVTAELVTETLNEATVTAKELADVALTAAGAAEQLWRSGKLERNERLDHAFAYVSQWFPSLDEDTIITALESAVLFINSTVAALPKVNE